MAQSSARDGQAGDSIGLHSWTVAGEAGADACPACGTPANTRWLTVPDRFHARTEPYDLARCGSCSLVWLHNRPLVDGMWRHYGDRYDRSVIAAGGDANRWRGRRATLLAFESQGKLLDIGCSSGGFLASLRSPSWQLFGIEMSEWAAKLARERSGAEVLVGDALDARFAPGTFDAITCFHVLEHLPQPAEVLARIGEWLKPGGIFYVMTPNIDSVGARVFGSYWYALEVPRHLYLFSPASLRKLCQSAGLEELSLTTHRELFIERSARYIVDDLLGRVGISRVPPADAGPPSVLWRVVRRMARWSLEPALRWVASLAGDGESIHAVFRKPLLT